MTRPIPGVGQALEYSKDGLRTMRCSLCHAERSQSPLVRQLARDEQLSPITVGDALLGVLCAACSPKFTAHVLAFFPESTAFPFVSERNELLPTPRCELGHALRYADDGRGMFCIVCDVEKAEPDAGH